MAYLNFLNENMSMSFPNSWVANHIKDKYHAFDHYPHTEEDAINIGIACNKSVIISLSSSLCL